MARIVRTQTATGDSAPTMLNHRASPFAVTVEVTITGTATASVYFTTDVPTDFASQAAYLANAVWIVHPNLSAITTTSPANIAYPVVAVKTTVSSYTSGIVSTTVMQAGI